MALGRIQGNTVLDDNGNPISGAVIRFYEVGTLTNKTIYSDQGLSISLGSFVTTDASGRFTIPYTTNPYKIRVEQSVTDSTLIYEQDHIGQDVADVNTQTAGLLTVSNVQNSVGTFSTTGGGSNAYTLTLSEPLTSYTIGQFLKFKANHTNTGAATINVSNVSVVDLLDTNGNALNAGDIQQDGTYTMLYNGSAWNVLIPSQSVNANNITSGTLSDDRLPATITKNTTGTHSGNVTGNILGIAPANYWNTLNDGTGSGLDADLLDGQQGSYYQNASNLNSGTISDSRLPSTITKNTTGTHSGTSTGNHTGNIQGVASSNYWNTTNDGSGSGLDSDLLDGQHGAYYQNASNLNAGTISDSRLPSTITSNITGNAATATNSTQLNGQAASFYTNASNLNSGTINADRLPTVPLSKQEKPTKQSWTPTNVSSYIASDCVYVENGDVVTVSFRFQTTGGSVGGLPFSTKNLMYFLYSNSFASVPNAVDYVNNDSIFIGWITAATLNFPVTGNTLSGIITYIKD